MSRRKTRELALQMLFQADITGDPTDQVQETFWEVHHVDDETRRYTDVLFRAASERLHQIDALIKTHAEHWTLKRMSVVDRNILRLAVTEFLVTDTPNVVVIDEAVELAHKYGSEKSQAFVNGILDRVRKEAEQTAV